MSIHGDAAAWVRFVARKRIAGDEWSRRLEAAPGEAPITQP